MAFPKSPSHLIHISPYKWYLWINNPDSFDECIDFVEYALKKWFEYSLNIHTHLNSIFPGSIVNVTWNDALKTIFNCDMAEHANKPLFNNLCSISEGWNLYSEAELSKLLATKVVILFKKQLL